MRILIVTDQLPPAFFGGMAQHAWHLARLLGTRHDVLVLTLRRAEVPEMHEFRVRRLMTKRFPRLDALLVEREAARFARRYPYSITLVTTPAPTVRPPSRIANFSPSSHAIVTRTTT